MLQFHYNRTETERQSKVIHIYMSKQKHQKNKTPKRPEKFKNYSDCLHWLKKSVYMIVRGRKTVSEFVNKSTHY